MSRSYSDMCSISGCFLRNEAFDLHNTLSNFECFIGHLDQFKVLKGLHSLSGGFWITLLGFVQYKLRNNYFEIRQTSFPPFVGNLLVGGYNQILARLGRVVAHDCSFQIDRRFHSGHFDTF